MDVILKIWMVISGNCFGWMKLLHKDNFTITITMYLRQTTHKEMIDAMRQCFVDYPEIEEEIRHYGIKRSFPNGQRCDLIFYKKSINILRFNRGAWMVRKEPLI